MPETVLERTETPTETDIPELKEEKEGSDKPKTKVKKSLWKRISEIGTVSPKEVVEFTRHLSVMLTAGVTIFEGITFLKEQSQNKVFATKLDSILESLSNGQSLSNSLKKYPKLFPPIYVNIVQVGEESGTLAETMTDLANHSEETEAFKKKVKSALVYPKIIFGVMILFVVILVVFVMPRILGVFESLGAEIPLATRSIIAVTNFTNQYWPLVIGIIAGVWGFYKILLKNEKIQRWRDSFILKFPIVGRITLNYNTAQVSQHFGALFASGIPIVKGLEITQKVIENKIIQEEIGFMVERIRSGSALSQSFKSDSKFPPMFLKLIRVGERTGKLPQVIAYTKDYYRNLVDGDVKNITTIIEPVIMVLLGLLVAGLIVTVIGPIYQLISNVSQ